MKGIVYSNYGSPDVLKCEEIEKPTAGDNEILLKVCAASVNPLDSHLMKGKPYIARILFGLRKPKITRPGRDVAGEVEAVGRNVTQFKPGDEVFGLCQGAFAEYACAVEDRLALKPANISFEDAAAVPVAAITALRGLRDKGRIQRGHKVLVDGASGGVGTFAVQIAKSFGAEVTAVCSTRNVDTARSIGADHVIDYTREDFTQSGQRYPPLLDHDLRLLQRVKDLSVQALVSQLPVEAFTVAVFPRTPRLDVQRSRSHLRQPTPHFFRNELRAIIRTKVVRNSPLKSFGGKQANRENAH